MTVFFAEPANSDSYTVNAELPSSYTRVPGGSIVGSQPIFSAYHARAFARSRVARLGWTGASVITDGLVAVAWVMAASSIGAILAPTTGSGGFRFPPDAGQVRG